MLCNGCARLPIARMVVSVQATPGGLARIWSV